MMVLVGFQDSAIRFLHSRLGREQQASMACSTSQECTVLAKAEEGGWGRPQIPEMQRRAGEDCSSVCDGQKCCGTQWCRSPLCSGHCENGGGFPFYLGTRAYLQHAVQPAHAAQSTPAGHTCSLRMHSSTHLATVTYTMQATKP